jgi:hypothetical protein
MVATAAVGIYGLGLTIGALGTVLALNGGLRIIAGPFVHSALIPALGLLLIGAVDLRNNGRPAFGRSWQVPKRLVGRFGLIGSFGAYGVMLGSGCWTLMPAALFWSYLLFATTMPSLSFALIMASIFAAVSTGRLVTDLLRLGAADVEPILYARRRLSAQATLRATAGSMGLFLGTALLVRTVVPGW